MASIHFDGYYFSGPLEWEDWHAGVRMHGINHHYTRYYPDGQWLHCYRDHDFAFWDFTESVAPELFADAKRDAAPRIRDADPMCTAGDYSIDGDILTRVLAPDWTGGQTWETQYRILDDRLVTTNSDGPTAGLLFKPKPLT